MDNSGLTEDGSMSLTTPKLLTINTVHFCRTLAHRQRGQANIIHTSRVLNSCNAFEYHKNTSKLAQDLVSKTGIYDRKAEEGEGGVL